MNSRRSSRFSQSPTVVQSPASLSSHRVSSPVTPVLQVDMDRVPFSESFPGIIRARHEYNDSFYSSGSEGVNNGGIMTHSSSFHIERITNIKEIDPQWEHDEIEEIMVISPKARTRSSFLDLGSSNRLSVPDFEVLQVLGKEPSIQTILARSCSDFGLYAIKTMRKRAVSAPNILKHVRSEQTCLRIITEGDSVFLPKLHRSFQDETRLYMVLDTYPGGSIAAHLDRRGPFGPEKARFYASEIAEALSYLHSLCIVHRDVKPENVMIAADGHIVLTNFNCAKMLDHNDSTTSNCGTKEFEAPERILGWTYDYTVDVWSFGVLLCIMHFGQHPFLEGDELDPLLIMQKRILRGQEPRHPPQSNPLSEWGLIKKCLERNPHLRPSMTQVKTHEYFAEIDWMKVKTKGYDVPYIPYGDEVDLLNVDEDNFHFYEKSDLLELDDSPTTEVSDFNGYSYTWDQNSTSPAAQKTAHDIPKATVFEDRDKSSAIPVLRNHIRSILKSPSSNFPGDSKTVTSAKPGDFLDLRHSTSHLSLCAAVDRPRKLRKKRLSESGTAARSSILSNRISMASLFSEASERRNAKERTSQKKFPIGCENSVSSATLNLPKGIVQSGQGISFTYTPQASRSRLSLSSTTSKSCFKGFSTLFGMHGRSPENLPKSRTEVMQQIYGSTWSIHTNEARMSTVTFGIPDGLGRRVDSTDGHGEPAVVG